MTETVFDQDAAFWWDAEGPFKMLHRMNPLRKDFVAKHIDCAGKTFLDVGCGGGLFCESLVDLGAEVYGIDESQASIEVAKAHAKLSNKRIDYTKAELLAFAKKKIGAKQHYDAIAALEMLEHVEDPQRIVNALSHMLKPGGYAVFSTINRNLWSFFGAIIAAEYLLGWVQEGTHQYPQFIKPSELVNMAEKSGLFLQVLQGISLDFAQKKFNVTEDVSINYIALFQKATPA